MGLLSAAIFQGAGQGLNVLSQGMLRQVEREAEDDIWQKRTRLLSEIQRENAKVIREDDFRFRNDPTNVQAEVDTATTRARAAAGVAREEAVKTETDPALISAREAEAERQRARETARIKTLAPEEAKRAGMITSATVSAQERARAAAESKRVNPLVQIARDYKEATGIELPPETMKQLADAKLLGLTKEDNKFAIEAFKAVGERYKEGVITPESNAQREPSTRPNQVHSN